MAVEEPPSITHSVCELVQRRIAENGAAVEVSAVVRDVSGNKVVRMRPRAGCSVHLILRSLQKVAPLAQLRSLTSEVDGSDEVELQLPTRRNLRRRAWVEASSGIIARAMWKLVQGLLLVSFALVVSVLLKYRFDEPLPAADA